MNSAERWSLAIGATFGFVLGAIAVIVLTDAVVDHVREPVWDRVQVEAAARAGLVVPVQPSQLTPCEVVAPEPAPCPLTEISLATPFCFGCYGMDTPELWTSQDTVHFYCKRGWKMAAQAMELR